MLFMYLFQIVGFLFLIVKEVTGVLLPNFSLFVINLSLVDLSLLLFVNLFIKILSHLLFLFFLFSLSSLFIFSFFLQLVLNMFHHLLIFSFDLIFLILYYWISKWSHNLFDFILSLFFLLFSSLLELILKSSVFFLSLDILNKYKITSNLYLYASALSLLWFS